jgi:hypothetical protein
MLDELILIILIALLLILIAKNENVLYCAIHTNPNEFGHAPARIPKKKTTKTSARQTKKFIDNNHGSFQSKK